MLVVHHLHRSQSDRIVWLCEELGLPYELKLYSREPTGAAPPSYKALYAFGSAPVIQDGDLTLGESGAIIEYICQKYGHGRLTVGPDAPNFAEYLFWLHFGNGSFVPAAIMALLASLSPTAGSDRRQYQRFDRSFEMAEKRLGEALYFAGADLTAADIMMVYPMTGMRLNVPKDLSAFPNIRAYLQRIGARPAFQRACQKADPDLVPNLT
jgi:glutathione S-transferase